MSSPEPSNRVNCRSEAQNKTPRLYTLIYRENYKLKITDKYSELYRIRLTPEKFVRYFYFLLFKGKASLWDSMELKELPSVSKQSVANSLFVFPPYQRGKNKVLPAGFTDHDIPFAAR